jgi:hypothetical protein
MAPPREDDLAWELVERYRDLMTAEQCTEAFVLLGVGDYSEAIRGVLNAVVTHKVALSERSAADVQSWIICYDTEVQFGQLLTRASRAPVME